MRLLLFTDGGARGNPGPAGIGFVIQNEKSEVLTDGKKFLGRATNNQAEYQAILAGLITTLQLKPTQIDCFLDSELVVKQLNRQYRVKELELKKLFEQVQLILFQNPQLKITFTHIPRGKNRLADKLVNEAIDEKTRNPNLETRNKFK